MEIKSIIVNIKNGDYGRQLSTNIAGKDEEANWVTVVGDCFNHLAEGSYKVVFNKASCAFTQLEGDQKKKLFFEGIISASIIKKKEEKPKNELTPVEDDGLPF